MEAAGKPSRICVVCQKDLSYDAAFCPNCGHNYGGPTGSETSRKMGSLLPVIGGLAILVAGLMHIANSVVTICTGGTYYDADETNAYNLVMIHSVVYMIAGLIAVVGGLRATRRKDLAFSLASGFCAFVVIGLAISGIPSLFYASYLALAGVILVAMAQEEFDS